MRAEAADKIESDGYEKKTLSALLNDEIHLYKNVQEGELDAVQYEIENRSDDYLRILGIGNITGNALQDAKYYKAMSVGILCRLCVSVRISPKAAS